MFRHLRGSYDGVDTQYLAEIWKMSFTNAKACFRSITMYKQNIKIEIEMKEDVSLPEHHKILISEFSPGLDRICATVMHHYIPMSPSAPGWNISEIRDQMKSLGTEEEFHTRSACSNSCYILYAIVCGAIYGLCSNACFDDGDVLSEYSEVAFAPDILSGNGGRKLKEWATIVGQGMKRHQVFMNIWSDLLFELFLAKDTESSMLKSMNAPSSTEYANRQNPHRLRLLLGTQSNGLTAVSDILVKLTTTKESFCYFHIKRGQVLSFLLTEDYYIQASTYLEPASTLALDLDPKNSVL
ncbi:MAG: hypothetical protein Q9226_008875, partial [Calogaya cf. arnoldii]